MTVAKAPRKRRAAGAGRSRRVRAAPASPVDTSAGILLVDDQPARLAALEAAFEGLGDDVELVKATSGKEALRALLQRDFALILLDVHMPVMDGFETASLIRQRRRSERTPIIFITAFGPDEARVTRGYSLGAVDYIFAPVVADVLRAKATVFLDLHRKTIQVKRQADWLREEAEARAAALETRLRGLLDRLEVGVFRATPEGRVLETNRACLNLLGAADVAEASRALARLGPPPPPEPGGKRRTAARDVRLELPGRSDRWLSVSTAAAAGPGGEGLVDGILEDVTTRVRAAHELRTIHEALEDQAGRLERSNADLQRFAHVISHDLQEPLRMVSTFTDLLGQNCRDALDTESLQYLEYAREGAERMRGMIHGLLDFCLVERAEGKPRPTDCNALVDASRATLLVAIRESGADVTRDELPVVEADELLLGSVFQNLLANAVKFRRDGVPARVHVGAERRDGEWIFSVRDNGIGIPPADAERLFGVFRRLPGAERFPGSGMGLAICKRIVERHGGRIWTEPADGGGSLFRFALPARGVPLAAGGAAEAEKGKEQGR